MAPARKFRARRLALRLIRRFVGLRGGNTWPDTIRRSPRKALRVFLQDGDNDLDVILGHWLHANLQMGAALTYADYHHRLVVGSGGHSLKHGGALLPDTLRWMWGARRMSLPSSP